MIDHDPASAVTFVAIYWWQLADAVERYATLRGVPLGPVGYLERTYQANVRKYLDTGRTPSRTSAGSTPGSRIAGEIFFPGNHRSGKWVRI